MAEAAATYSPPYLPWKTFFNFLDRLADEGAPDRIDRSFLKTMDGQTQSYLMAALRSFGLMTGEGRVTEALGPLVNHATRQDAVRRLLETYYAPMVALPTNATQAQLDETFRPFQLGSDATRKAETFYLRAAAYAELPLSPNFKNPAGSPSEGGTNRSQGRPRSGRRGRPRTGGEETPPPPQPNPNANSGGGMGISTNVHLMLAGPIQWLSENGPTWTEPQAAAWIDAFTKQVRLVYPPTGRPRTTSHAKPAPTPEAEEEVGANE